MTARAHKLTLEQTIAAARRQGEIDEIVRKTLAMSDEGIERELALDGVDVKALDERLAERGREIFAKTSGSDPEAPK